MEADANPAPASAYARLGKPILDRIVGLILAILTLPVVLVLLLMAWVAFGWPPLQRAPRAGRNAGRFNLYRVNTRKDYQTDLRGRHLRLSRLLRSTSLDELPQLWNVVLGHMSLVGPRPLDPAMALQLDDEASIRHSVRPGLTGLWQLRARGDGRHLMDNLSLDLKYVEDMSFWKDLGILARTVPTVFRHRESV
ncbi:MAG: sugar transferase [Acidimicrobiia bacterium]|nr:sugar transferase [Acidimicrobiia bacterium]